MERTIRMGRLAERSMEKRKDETVRRDETTSYGMDFASVMQYEFHFLGSNQGGLTKADDVLCIIVYNPY